MWAASNSIRAGRAFVELFADDSKLVRGLKAAQRKLQAFGKTLTAAGTKVFAAGAGIVTPMLAAAKHFADAGDELEKMSRRTGISVEALSELKHAADLSGASFADVEKGVRTLQRSVLDLARGSGESVESFAALGLSLADIEGQDPEQIFLLLADRLSRIPDMSARAALAMKLFGRSGTAILPLLENGAAGIDALRQEARRLGLTISTEDAQAAAQFKDALSTLWSVVKRLWFEIGAALAPALKLAAEWITRVVVSMKGWIKEHRGLIVTILAVGAGLAAFGVALLAVGWIAGAVGTAIGVLSTILTALGTVLGVIGSILGAILTPVGLVIAAVVALGAAILYYSGAGGKALNWLKGVFGDLKDDALAAFGGIGDALAAGDIGLAAKILWLTLKLEWEKGIAWLSKLWLDFRNFFIRLSYDAFYGAVKACLVVWHGLEIAWIETTSFLSNVWTRFCQGIGKAWNWAGAQVSKAWSWLKGLFDKSFDSDAASTGADEWLAAENRKVDEQANGAVRAREAQRERERQREDEIHERAMQSVGEEQAAKKKALDDEYDQRIAAAQGEVDAARKEWQEAIAEAKRKRGEKDAGKPSGRKEAGDFDWDGLFAGTEKAAREMTLAAQGTFNASALQGLSIGGASAMDRTAKASERVAENTGRLVDMAGDGGLAFEP
jgi:TP901 family phage tail tape measure protein